MNLSGPSNQVQNADESATRVIVLDDHPALVDGLSSFVNVLPQFRVVAQAENLHDVDKYFSGGAEADIIMCDLKLKDGFSFDWASRAKKNHPQLKIMFMTGLEEETVFARALAVQPDAFVLKTDPLQEFANALEEIRLGKSYRSPAAHERLEEIEEKARTEGGLSPVEKLAQLTKREREILALVSRGKTAREIAKDLNISMWTVTNHKANIMGKLNIHNQVGLTRFALAAGLVEGN